MRAILALLVLAAGCGRSECADYCIVSCSKYSTCISPIGDTKTCESGCVRQLEAQRADEPLCKRARENVQAMSCQAYRDFIAANSR